MRSWRDTMVTRAVINGPTKGVVQGTRTFAESRGRDRSSRTSLSVAATEARSCNVAIARDRLWFHRACACSNRWTSRGEATAQAQDISGTPAHDSNDRTTTTLSSSNASGNSENSENSANRSSTTTQVQARDNRTASAGETIDPNGFDGDSMTTSPFSGISDAKSGPTTASQPGPRVIEIVSDPRQLPRSGSPGRGRKGDQRAGWRRGCHGSPHRRFRGDESTRPALGNPI